MVEIEKVYRVDGFIFEDIENAEKFKFFIEKYNYNKMQKDIIYSGLKNKLNVSLYANPEFNGRQMDIIFMGLEKGLDINWYSKPEFDYKQMEQIRLGLEECLDVSYYANPKITIYGIVKIKNALSKGNIKEVNNLLNSIFSSEV